MHLTAYYTHLTAYYTHLAAPNMHLTDQNTHLAALNTHLTAPNTHLAPLLLTSKKHKSDPYKIVEIASKQNYLLHPLTT